ncbi:Glutaminyl-peptide cyclotransferase [Cladophialophora carrionii]|uniref:Peptide hydrolase n=1 Tax=Cladophialophora carrionii TaxID=86049 RepID=A0A1C1D0K9_9EURO|nr:Glutaminyl-peptide cyclotransferase [Cladophialophora carrionii]
MWHWLLKWSLTTVSLLSLLSSHGLAYAPLSDGTILDRLPQPDTADFDIHTGNLLAPILIPRVPGTEGSRKVLQHFVDFFHRSLPDWTVSFQNSTSKTPTHGDNEVPFVNLIATRDPPWADSGNVGRLTLVAHYDSKYQPDGFIGATDSAAPCAMIMHAIKSVDAALAKKWDTMRAQGFTDPDFEEQKGIQVLFLDGEEAFLSWTATDSIYGARSLAEEWEHTVHPATSIYKNYLDSIELFVLLDLLGSPEDLPIPSWQHSSHWSYVRMAEAEQRLRKLGLFRSKSRTWLSEKDKKETDRFQSYVMQDDHIPFIARGVQVLHLIPARFPSVWHTIRDDGDHLDIPTVEDWALLTTVFAAEYMELEGFFDEKPASQRPRRHELTSKDEL